MFVLWCMCFLLQFYSLSPWTTRKETQPRRVFPRDDGIYGFLCGVITESGGALWREGGIGSGDRLDGVVGATWATFLRMRVVISAA